MRPAASAGGDLGAAFDFDLHVAFAGRRDGYTTGGGLGLGLSGARRLVDEFDINTAVGQGTTISVIKWCR